MFVADIYCIPFRLLQACLRARLPHSCQGVVDQREVSNDRRPPQRCGYKQPRCRAAARAAIIAAVVANNDLRDRRVAAGVEPAQAFPRQSSDVSESSSPPVMTPGSAPAARSASKSIAVTVDLPLVPATATVGRERTCAAKSVAVLFQT